MAGIDPDKARALFHLPESVEPFTALAIGYPGDPDTAEEEFARRDARTRERKAIDELIIRGGF
jgi:hypothetical protein